MKTAIVGAAGQLGRDLQTRITGTVLSLGRAEADLTMPDRLRATLKDIRPDRVINCAAYNLVDNAESEPEIAFATNAFGVRRLAEVCDELQVPLVHFSTDYVFGQSISSRPWQEVDAPGPVSVYGCSKLSGEHFVLAASPRNLVIRVCGLYGVWGSGGKGGNFVETMLRVAGQGKPLRVVDDQRCTPTSTKDVAEITLQLLECGAQGLLHFTNRGDCSWYEFAREIFQQSGLQPSLTAIPSREYPTAARRPAYSVLDTHRVETILQRQCRPWQEALADYLRDRQQRFAG